MGLKSFNSLPCIVLSFIVFAAEVFSPVPYLPYLQMEEKYDSACFYFNTFAEEAQWRAQTLEDIQRRLEEEHALQVSLLLAEHEKEQQRLRLVSTKYHTVSLKLFTFIQRTANCVAAMQKGNILHHIFERNGKKYKFL